MKNIEPIRCGRTGEEVDPLTGFCLFHITAPPYPEFFNQDYCAVTLFCGGQVLHAVNGVSEILTGNVLLFFRPGDLHYYRSIDESRYERFVLCFAPDTLREVGRFLGKGFDTGYFFQSFVLPAFRLSTSEKLELEERLVLLKKTRWDSKKDARVIFRALLAQLLTHCLDSLREARSPALPRWLDSTCREMRKRENFVGGVQRMCAIAHRSRQHLWRAMKKHFEQSPIEFVTGLRVGHAAELLAHTDMKVVVMALECGFDSVGQFYKVFKTHFGTPPGRFRKTSWGV